MTGEIEGLFYFDPDDRIYSVHFPDHPVVPGSVIIHAFLEALSQKDICPSFISLEKFRFKRFIKPGEYRYTITMEEDKIRCFLYDGDKAVITGVIRS